MTAEDRKKVEKIERNYHFYRSRIGTMDDTRPIAEGITNADVDFLLSTVKGLEREKGELKNELYSFQKEAVDVAARNVELNALLVSLEEENKNLKWLANDNANKYDSDIASLRSDLGEEREEKQQLQTKFDHHRRAVGDFLSEMYATVIDPLADGKLNVQEVCAALIKQARKDRESLAQLSDLQVQHLAAEDKGKKIKELLRKANSIICWMSGSPSFGPTGEAYLGWQKVQSNIQAIKEVLDKPDEIEEPPGIECEGCGYTWLDKPLNVNRRKDS